MSSLADILKFNVELYTLVWSVLSVLDIEWTPPYYICVFDHKLFHLNQWIHGFIYISIIIYIANISKCNLVTINIHSEAVCCVVYTFTECGSMHRLWAIYPIITNAIRGSNFDAWANPLIKNSVTIIVINWCCP